MRHSMSSLHGTGKLNESNSQHRSKTNLDEYINFFDSSVASHPPLRGDIDNISAGAVPNNAISCGQDDDEHTTTKKRQRTSATATTQQYLGVDLNQFLGLQANTVNQAHQQQQPQGFNPNVMQSPLASYLYQQKTGTSASYHQQVSVFSDCKDADQLKTTHKTLQSPPEFASPREYALFTGASQTLGQPISSLIEPANHPTAAQESGAQPHLNNNLNQNLLDSSNLKVAMNSSNIQQPPRQHMQASGTFSNQQPQHQQSAPNFFASNIGRQTASFTGLPAEQLSDKLSFSQFYEQTVSPHSRNLSSAQHQNQSQFLMNTTAVSESNTQRPFTSLANKYNNQRDMSETESFACDQIMEQIAAIIDYDITEYLPPGCAPRSSPYQPLSQNYKAAWQIQQRAQKPYQINNFVGSSAPRDQPAYVSKESRFSYKRQKTAQNVSKTPKNQSLVEAQKYQSHSSTVHNTRGSNHQHTQSHTGGHRQNSSLTCDEDIDDEQEIARSHRKSSGSLSETSHGCCTSAHSHRQRHRQHGRKRRHVRRNSNSVEHQDSMHSSTNQHSSEDEKGWDQTAPPSCSNKHRAKRHLHERNQKQNQSRENRCRGSCCRQSSRGHRQRSCCHSQSHDRSSHQKHHQHKASNISRFHGSSQHLRKENFPPNHHNVNQSYHSKSNHNCSSQEQLQPGSGHIEASDRQKLALMILQGDRSVQIVKQQDPTHSSSPHFQLQMLPHSENSDKNHLNLLNSLIHTSDFQTMIKKQPETSRNRHIPSVLTASSNHILISGGDGSSGSPSQKVDKSHSRVQSVEALPSAKTQMLTLVQPQQLGVGMQRANSTHGSGELIHLTQIHAAPQGMGHLQSQADMSQQNTIQEIREAFIEEQHTADAQTSFSHLYEPYIVPSTNPQNLQATQSTQDELKSSEDLAKNLNVEFQSTFAPNIPNNNGSSKQDDSCRQSLFSDKSRGHRTSDTQADVVKKLVKTKKAMSLTDSVILIQRSYRAKLARADSTSNQEKGLDHKKDSDLLSVEAKPEKVQVDKEQKASPQKTQQANTEIPEPNKYIKTTEAPIQDQKSLRSTQEAESSDIELPEMFEYDNWWLESEQPMTDDCLTAFLKKHL